MRSISLTCILLAALAGHPALASDDANGIELAKYQDQVSRVRVSPARREGQIGLGVFFSGTSDLHYYATRETAPEPGLELQIKASGSGITLGDPVFPRWRSFHDPQGKEVDVYAGDFQVFVPIRGTPPANPVLDAHVTVSGLACTSQVCLAPFNRTLQVAVDANTASWPVLDFEQAPGTVVAARPSVEVPAPPYGIGISLLLAVVAGVSINVMPCVLPVIPLIIMRLIRQSQQAGKASVTSGLVFCGGIVLFFAVFTGVAAILHVFFGTVVALNSLFRYPAAAITLFLVILLFALTLLDVVTLTLPAAITRRQGSGTSLAGAVGMGFFAATLSIPCSGALLAFVVVWAQTQPQVIASLAVILMGVGMALPYAVLVLMPGLMSRLPRPGAWMDLFKKSCGFLLLLVAVKLCLPSLTKGRMIDVLLYGVVFSFCAWMWGGWVNPATSPTGRRTVRLIAVAIALLTGGWLLPAGVSAGPGIAWQDYDPALVEQAKSEARPVLLDFMADWCTNCKVLDRLVYADKLVVDQIARKDVLAIRADTTSFDSPATRDLTRVYGEAGNVPVTILILAGKPPILIRGLFTRERLLDLLSGLPDRENP
jgi:thiol:disulfide interchange protein